jgi:hypothetical protein
VDYPYVGFPVLSRVRLPVDAHGGQARREHVVAGLGEPHLRPGLPVCDGAGDVEGSRDHRADAGAQLDVRPHPRIEGRPVVTGPAGVALDGDGRVAVLVAGADWRDQVRQARLAGQGRHRPQHDRGQSPALVPGRHLGRHRTDRRWPPACRPEPEGASDRRVDTGAKVLVGAVPSHRDRVALGQDRLVCGVDEHELPLGEDVVKLSPVVVELVAVLVVLGPYAVEQITEGVPQFRPLAITDNPRIHEGSILVGAAAVQRVNCALC